MKFQLPQFIETEVKLVGPFTLRQFMWIGGGSLLIFVLSLIIHSIWFFVIAIPIAIIAIAFAFIKVADVPLVTYLAYILSYALNPKRYIYAERQEKDVFVPDSARNLKS